MFLRRKKVRDRVYLQIVENRWEQGKVRQRVIASLGRLDRLLQSGSLDALLESASRLSESLMLLSAHGRGELSGVVNRRIGPSLVFGRLWKRLGLDQVIGSLLRERSFEFDLERAVFLTVLHRLVDPGSDRAAEKWKQACRIEGAEQLQLHHLYRAMHWLGEPLPEREQGGRTPFAPRCTKDLIEERLFQRRRDLFTSLDLVFFDTTSIFFEGSGGETLGERGYSRDHRPDLAQMVVGVVIDSQGVPLCCEMWPGSTADVKALIPVVDRLRKRFLIEKVCIVADRGMLSQQTLDELESEQRRWDYILGVRMRKMRQGGREVLSRPGRFREVRPARSKSKDPAPLKVKNVELEGQRFIVCLNEEQARSDAAMRQAVVESLREKLRGSAKKLVGNKGYRKFLKRKAGSFQLDEEKVRAEARYDGKWVVRTSLDLPAEEVALKYKQLWMVEDMMRSIKSVLQTRPVFHRTDEAIRGHVFCSFLALVLRKELQDRLEKAGRCLQWDDVIRDLDRLEEIEVESKGKRLLLRTDACGVSGIVCQAAGVALPPNVRRLEG